MCVGTILKRQLELRSCCDHLLRTNVVDVEQSQILSGQAKWPDPVSIFLFALHVSVAFSIHTCSGSAVQSLQTVTEQHHFSTTVRSFVRLGHK